MSTFLKISWRNIHRNFRRTMILAIIISIGYLGMIFTLAFMQGYLDQAIDNVVNSSTGHIQIHQEGFLQNPTIKKRIQNPKTIDRVLQKQDQIKRYAPRIKSQGIINSSESSLGVLIVGINPEQEGQVSNIKTALVEGEYLQEDDHRSIYLGKALAKKLKVGLDDKVVLMGQTVNYDVGGGAYRIKGLFQTSSPGFDKSMAYITLPAAQTLFDMKQSVSEFVIIANDGKQLPALQGAINAALKSEGLEIMTWQEIMPMIATMLESSSAAIYILLVIILIAICFSIVNTLFVVVFERFREFGIMKAMGTRSRHIFMLVIFEALGMTAIGLFFGGILTALVMSYFMTKGLNLAAYAEGLSMLSVGDIIYMTVTPGQIFTSLFLTFLLVTLAAIYPAMTAAKIKPLDALKFI